MKTLPIQALRISFAMLMCFVSSNLMAQESALSYLYNGIRIGDHIAKQQVEYVTSGDDGEDCTWDFSNLQYIREYPIEYFCDSDSVVIYELSPVQINKYPCRTDSLLFTGYETPLQRVDYYEPVHLLVYPLEYGMSFSAPYHGTGTYCKTHLIDHQGIMDVEADATGILILSDEDTLRNVLRIHSIRTGSLYMHHENDSTAEARSRTKQEIEERYQWYARGYRYPLLETIVTSYYTNLDPVSSIRTAYCYAPGMQQLLVDKPNEDLKHADSIADSFVNVSDIIRYTIHASGNMVRLNYSLTEQARITTIVCNHRGMAYRRNSVAMPAGEGYEMLIDCTGLQSDTYILYINVNGKVYSEKVNIE